MSISIPCPKCGKTLRLPDASVLGKTGRCPKCQHKFVLQKPDLEEPEEEPDEVPLELVQTHSAGSKQANKPAPKVGTAAEWIPDEAPSSGVSPVAPASLFDAPIEPPTRSKRIRKERPLPQRIAIFATFVIAAVGLAYGYTVLAPHLQDAAAANKKQAKKADKKAEPADDAEALAAAGAEDGSDPAAEKGEQKFGRPTSGKPIDLLWIPSGARIVISMRPAELWKAGAKGEGEFISTLGPFGTWMESTMSEFVKAKPHQIEELLLCVIPGPSGTPPTYSAVVRRTKEHKFLKSALMEGMTAVDTGPIKYYADEKWAIAFQPDMVTYAISPVSAAAEMISASRQPNPTAGEIEELLRFTDRSLHFTILCVPTDLKVHGEVLVPQNVQPLLENIQMWIAGANDEVESAAWSFHLSEDQFYSQIMLRNRGLVKPHLLSSKFQTQLASTPRQILEVIQLMDPKKVGPRQVIGRVPAMVKVLQLGTKFQTDKQLVSLSYNGPERAAPNLALGALLAWDESNRTDFKTSPVAVAPVAQSKKPLKELLKSKIDVEFARTPLEDAFNFIANEAKFTIYVDGDGLKTAGYTKNMPQEFKAEGIAASDALAKIQSRYDKMCFVVDEAKNQITVTVYEKAKAQNQKIIEFK